MAGGTITFPASGYLEGKIEWESSSNGSAANTSTVTAILSAHRTNSYTTTGQSWSGYVKIQAKNGNQQQNISFPQSVTIGPNWYEMARVTFPNAQHNDDGTGSVYISGSVTGPSGTKLEDNTSADGKTVTLDKIPRKTSITSFTVSKRNETSFTFAWSTADTVDYVYYSTNNGSSWTGYDVTDGKSGSFTVSGLSANTSYNCKLRVRRKDSQLTTDSSTVSQTTYKVPTQALSSKTETSLKMNWAVDSTADYIWYSKDNGSNWTAVGSVNATSGSYTISSLSANTSYNIKTRVRRKASQTTYDTTASTQTTYNYPNITAVQTSTLVIGNSQKLTLYNPLSRTVTIKMYQNNTSGTQLYSGTTSGTSITFTPTASTLYASIPNSTSGTCVYSAIYSSSTKTTSAYTYKIVGTEKPTFTNFTYEDTDSTILSLTGNNQIIVNGYSNIKATISTANKAVAKNSATMKTYKMTIGNKTTNAVNYSSSAAVTLSLPDVNSGTITVYATDSRGLSTSVSKTATFKNYSAPAIKAVTATRGNSGVGSAVTLAFNGTYWNSSFGSVTNSITQVKYFYKETSASSWKTGTTTLSVTTSGANWSGSASIKGDLGANGFDVSKAYNIRFQIKDAFITKNYDITLGSGTPAISIYKNKVAINQKYDTSDTARLQVNGGVSASSNIFWKTFAGNDKNCNDYRRSGSYYFGTGNTNTPNNKSYIRTFISGGGNDCTQIASSVIDNLAWIRTSSNGTDFSPWEQIVTITESGSNSNGTYIKYSDGTMICTKTLNLTNVPFNYQQGALYFCPNQSLGATPATFTTIYGIFVNTVTTNGISGGAKNYSNTSFGQIQFYRGNNTTQSTITLSLFAIGRWK